MNAPFLRQGNQGQRDQETCPGSHREEVVGQGFQPGPTGLQSPRHTVGAQLRKATAVSITVIQKSASHPRRYLNLSEQPGGRGGCPISPTHFSKCHPNPSTIVIKYAGSRALVQTCGTHISGGGAQESAGLPRVIPRALSLKTHPGIPVEVRVSLEGGEKKRREQGRKQAHSGMGQLWVSGAAQDSAHPLRPRDLGGTDRQYLPIVLVLQLLHVSPPNS